MLYKVVSRICQIIINIRFKVEIIGLENLPLEGACIIASNHKSNWDAIILAGLLRKRKLSAVAKKELFKNPVLKVILNKLSVIPVNRDKPELSTIKSVLKILKNNESIVIFPEGTRHKDLDSFAEPKQGIGMFALKSKSPIVPISIISNYKAFSRLTLVIGEPMAFSEYHDKRNGAQEYEEVSKSVMNIIEGNYFKNIKYLKNS